MNELWTGPTSQAVGVHLIKGEKKNCDIADSHT